MENDPTLLELYLKADQSLYDVYLDSLMFADFYKVGHVVQYPENVYQVFVNWTPRYTHVEGQNEVVFFGLQYFMLEYLVRQFNKNFFQKPLDEVLRRYQKFIRATLRVENPKVDHIIQLHKAGFLPIKIYALPEGTVAPLGVPQFVITNTLPFAFWVPNYLETLISTILWRPSTSATTARRYRKLLMQKGIEAGERDLSYVETQGHDFSMRGMGGIEDGMLSGMGHLLSFSGTDTMTAILGAHNYYNADLSVGGSINATEHSVMQAGNKLGELATFDRLITKVYPDVPVSIVSDTWDLWRVLTDYVPQLETKIVGRKNVVVFRPDSGNPVKILCGDPSMTGINHDYNTPEHPAYYGTLALLADALGKVDNPTGTLPLIRKAAAIYGDSITIERADAILTQMVHKLKLSPKNVVFGIGSFTYAYVTRDTYGFAMKATAVRLNSGELVPIWKDPVTDTSGKKSHVGIPVVVRENGVCTTRQRSNPEDLDNCEFVRVFEDGEITKTYDFNQIRERARA